MNLAPLLIIDGEKTGGLSAKHWHFAFTIFHAVRETSRWHPYPVTLTSDDPDDRDVNHETVELLEEDHIHFGETNTRVRVLERLGAGAYGTAYKASVSQMDAKTGEFKHCHNVVLKVCHVNNVQAIRPVGKDSSVLYLDSSVMEPLSMAILQSRWPAAKLGQYAGAKFFCSFLTKLKSHVAQVTVMTYEEGTVVSEWTTGEDKFREFVRFSFPNTAEFVYLAHRYCHVDIMDRNSNNAIQKPDGRTVQLDFGLTRIRNYGENKAAVIHVYPDDVSPIFLDPDPMQSMRHTWAIGRHLFMAAQTYVNRLDHAVLEVGEEMRKHPQAWLFEDVLRRSDLQEPIKEACSVDKPIPAWFMQRLRQSNRTFCIVHEAKLAMAVFKARADEGELFFYPLDYAPKTILGYGKECAQYLVKHHPRTAVAIVKHYATHPTLRMPSYLPMLLFAALSYQQLVEHEWRRQDYKLQAAFTSIKRMVRTALFGGEKEEEVEQVEANVRAWALKRPNLVALLPVFFTEPADLKRCLQDLGNGYDYANIIRRHLAPVRRYVDPYDDELESITFFYQVLDSFADWCP